VLVRRPPPADDAPLPAPDPQTELSPATLAPVAVVPDVPPPPSPNDPQADLSTSIPGFIRMAQFGDFAALMQAYMPPSDQAQMPEEEKAKIIQKMKDYFQTPEGRQDMQQMLTDMQSVLYLTPSYDATGNTATYSGHPELTFVRENGRWYLK
jgi:hypothetical protein